MTGAAKTPGEPVRLKIRGLSSGLGRSTTLVTAGALVPAAAAITVDQQSAICESDAWSAAIAGVIAVLAFVIGWLASSVSGRHDPPMVTTVTEPPEKVIVSADVSEEWLHELFQGCIAELDQLIGSAQHLGDEQTRHWMNTLATLRSVRLLLTQLDAVPADSAAARELSQLFEEYRGQIRRLRSDLDRDENGAPAAVRRADELMALSSVPVKAKVKSRSSQANATDGPA